MLYRALSLSFLLNTLLFAGDVPKPSHTVEMVNSNPAKPVQAPQVEFKHPHTGEGSGGGGNSSSGVGSTAGGSVINLLSDLLRVEQPDIDKLRRDKQVADFHASLAKYGEHTTAQFFPELYEKYMRTKNPMPMGFAEPSPLVVTPNSVTGVTKAPTPTPAPAPTPAPVVAAPAPTPVVSTPKFPAGSIKVPAVITSGEPMLGGLQGNTSLVVPQAPTSTTGKSPFVILNRDKVPTLNEMTPPLSYTKPVSTPQPTEATPLSTFTPAPTQSDSLEWGKLLKDAGEGAAIAVAAIAVGYAAYKTTEGVYKGGKWLWKKAFGEAEKQIVQQAMPKSVHANLEFHQNTGHCETPPKIKKKPGCLRAEVQPGDPRTRGLADIEFPTDATHIFRDQWGHFVHDTPETRNLLRECYKKGTYHGFDGAGNHQFSMTSPKDGSQLWLKIREGGKISTAGCNEIHLPLSKETGFLFKPDCWKNPSAKGVGCTFIGGSLAGMSSQVAKANIPESVLFATDKEAGVHDLNFFPFYHEGYTEQFHPGNAAWRGMPDAPEGYKYEFVDVKKEGLTLALPPKDVTVEEVKEERASKMKYAIRMKKKNMEDYVVMEEMRKRNKQQAKVLNDVFFKKSDL
jgi:hypothetical protein